MKSRTAALASPAASALCPASASRSKHAASMAQLSTTSTYPPDRLAIRSRPTAWRRKEIWLASVETAPVEGVPSQRSSTSRSSETGWFADTRSRKRSALLLCPATSTGPVSLSNTREPRILNLTNPPIPTALPMGHTSQAGSLESYWNACGHDKSHPDSGEPTGARAAGSTSLHHAQCKGIHMSDRDVHHEVPGRRIAPGNPCGPGSRATPGRRSPPSCRACRCRHGLRATRFTLHAGRLSPGDVTGDHRLANGIGRVPARRDGV